MKLLPNPTPVRPELVEGPPLLVHANEEGRSFDELRTNRKECMLLPHKERGFTLTELMVVIFIIGLLTTVVLINVLPSQDRAMVTKARADIATLDNAMEQYRLDNLTYPGAADGINALKSPPAGLADPSRYRPGGYIRNLPTDPWGRPYQFAAPGRNGAPYDIFSLGSDGAPGGDGDKADIYGDQS